MTKGYKATYNYKCLNQTYEVGQEYKIEGKPQICVKGFHYCNNAMNVLIYYPIKPTFKLLEIQDLNTSESDFQYDYDSLSSKSCSNHIKIIREINDPDELMHLLGKNFTYDQENKILKINWRSGFYFVLFDDHDCVITTINHTNYKTYDDLINLRKQRLNDNEIFLELNKRWANDYLLKDNSICSYLPYIPLNDQQPS